jgi:hypothetical protein
MTPDTGIFYPHSQSLTPSPRLCPVSNAYSPAGTPVMTIQSPPEKPKRPLSEKRLVFSLPPAISRHPLSCGFPLALARRLHPNRAPFPPGNHPSPPPQNPRFCETNRNHPRAVIKPLQPTSTSPSRRRRDQSAPTCFPSRSRDGCIPTAPPPLPANHCPATPGDAEKWNFTKRTETGATPQSEPHGAALQPRLRAASEAAAGRESERSPPWGLTGTGISRRTGKRGNCVPVPFSCESGRWPRPHSR